MVWRSFVIIGFLATAAAEVRRLDGRDWSVRNSKGTINVKAVVPGGIYTDLIEAGVIRDYLFYEMNDMKYRWVGHENWIYSKNFSLTPTDLNNSNIKLVFHGLDTIASIWLNGKNVGVNTNMFVRTKIDVKSTAQEGDNYLEIKFKSPIKAGEQIARLLPYDVPPICHPEEYHGICNINMLRKMQASYSWDWGPAFPSVGIWKDVELELKNTSTLREIGITTRDLDSNPRFYLVEVTAWFDEPVAKGNLTISLPIENGVVIQYTAQVSSGVSEYKANLRLPKRNVRLWWPRGYGQQALYQMTVTYESNGEVEMKIVRVGIRTVKMVQSPLIYGQESKGLTFYLTVNRVPVFVKGSNWIPMDILPERGDVESRLLHLLNSAVEANMNSLRVWGGGVYESDSFYEICDEKGLLVWQDMMFACSMYPTTEEFLSSVEEEIRQQVKRLQRHPSIFAIGGNNENEAALVQNWYSTMKNMSLYSKDYRKLYVDTMMPIVEGLDKSRDFFTSSPSNGKMTEKDHYISSDPQNSLYGDAHFYIYMANMWDPMIYPTPRFVSEYGMQSLPSIHTLAKAIGADNLTWRSDVMLWRQHSAGGYSYIKAQVNFNLPWSNDLADIVYLSQINQAMAMKTETEHYRRYKTIVNDANEGRTMGALYWQLNDVWEAPSWSSIDYHGNWKMTQYFARDFLADLLIIPIKTAVNLEVYVVSDANIRDYPESVDMSVTTHLYKWESFQPSESQIHRISMQPGDSQLLYSTPLDRIYNGSKAEYFLVFELANTPGNFFFPQALVSSNYPNATVKIADTKLLSPYILAVDLETDAIALFVWLESPLQNKFTKYSENGFHMLTPRKTVNITVSGGVTKKFINSLTVRNLKKKYI